MSDTADPRLVNLMGALSLALVDRMREANDAAARHGAAAPAALVAMHEFLGGASMDRLRQVTGLSPSGAVRLVDRLVADGLVERRTGSDRRSLALTLTARGRRVARKVRAARAGAIDRALRDLPDDDKAALTRIAEKLVATLTVQRLDDRAHHGEPAGGWLCRLCDFAACGRPDGSCPAQNAASSAS